MNNTKPSRSAKRLIIGLIAMLIAVVGLRTASWLMYSASDRSHTSLPLLPETTLGPAAPERPAPTGFSRHLRLANGWILFCGAQQGVIILEDGACDDLTIQSGVLTGSFAGDATTLDPPSTGVIQYLAYANTDSRSIDSEFALLTLADLCAVPELTNMHTSLVVDLLYGASQSEGEVTNSIAPKTPAPTNNG